MVNKANNNTLKGLKSFLKSKKRRAKFRLKKMGELRHELTMKVHAFKSGKTFVSKRQLFSPKKITASKPDYPPNIKFLSSVKNLFSNNHYRRLNDGHLFLPECFSFVDNYEESFEFLKKLFVLFKKGNVEQIKLDYSKCKRIDVDASICMDIILAEFIVYINTCRKRGHKIYPVSILPINFQDENISNVLFSIGAYRNIKGLEIKPKNAKALPVLINSKVYSDRWNRGELHSTQIVEYIKSCLEGTGRELSATSETGFYKVVGEIMSNAEEHGTMPNRYAIGFFQETHNSTEDYGYFNFSIFNFGETIYQTFKSPNCLNTKVISEMAELSADFTKKGWFSDASFEEETLWTLYALQEGVTSREEKRGNGSIQYIENFFKLKGDISKDNVSKLVLISGNTRITFDGEYSIIDTIKEGQKRKYKMVTFNKSGKIYDEPDKKYVTFVPHFFPGTIISARILIKFDNTDAQNNGDENIHN